MTLRVGLVCPYSLSRPGGVQNHVLGLAAWLHSQGHEVHVLAPGRPDPAVLAGLGLPPGRVTSCGPGVPVAYNGSVARINFGPGVALRARAWLSQHRFDVLHVHEPMTPSVSWLALMTSRVPVTATFHTATPGSRTMRLAYRAMPTVARRIDSAIAVSGAAATVALGHGGVSATVVGNGIRLADHRVAPVAGRWRGGAAPVITFIGRYDERRKGFGVLLRALPAIRAAHPDVHVRVVGQGRARRRAGVDFLGVLTDSQRNDLLARTDVYVAPQTGRESFGIVLLEALASGAPVVASDLPAFREVLDDGAGPVGRLVRVGDAEALARAVVEVLDDRGRAAGARAQRGRRRAATFDWDVVGPRVLERYSYALRHHADHVTRGVAGVA